MNGLVPPRPDLGVALVMAYMLAIEFVGTVLGALFIRRMAKIRFMKAFYIMGVAMSTSWCLGLLIWNNVVHYDYSGLPLILAFIGAIFGLFCLFALWGGEKQ